MPDPQMIEVNAEDLRTVLEDAFHSEAAERLAAALPEPESPITVGCRVRDRIGQERTVIALHGRFSWSLHDDVPLTHLLSTLTYVGPGDTPPPAPIPAEAQAVIDAALRWTSEGGQYDCLALYDAVRAYREAQDRGR